jgi:NIMA (never in mitosis gene a)-related kinase
MFSAFEEGGENTLLQTIRIPKNLHMLTKKLPQPNYEKKQKAKNNSFTDENKESLPDIKLIQNNQIGKKSGQKKNEEEKKEETKGPKEDKNSVITTDNNNNNTGENNLKINNDQNQNEANTQKKKRRIEQNDRSLDNIKRNEIYVGSNNNNNIKVIKSENYEKNINKSIIRGKSPIEESKMMLPNIKNQQNNENK